MKLCIRGHIQEGANVYTGKDGRTQCMPCRRIVRKARRAKGYMTKAQKLAAAQVKAAEVAKKAGSGQIAGRTYRQQLARDAMRGRG